MANYKIIVSYDGTRYKGWQRLTTGDMTIQGKLEAILSRLADTPIEIVGSGRTDAGVHASGQTASFKWPDNRFDEIQLLNDINRYLPDDIAVTSIETVNERFHARFNAIRKTYCYTINTGRIPDVFRQRFQYHLECTLNLEAMKQAASLLLGTHDFTAFCGNSHLKKSAVRTIESIEIINSGNIITLRYTGDGFLQNMIRIMTGTLIEIGRGERAPESITSILDSRNRANAGYTVPPQGLILESVEYD